MPTVTVDMGNGRQWLVTQCEIVIPTKDTTEMTPEEIGAHVLALIPRIQRVAPYVNEWDYAPKRTLSGREYLRTLQDVEAYVEAQEAEKQAREVRRQQSPTVRRHLQADYAHIFMTIGRRDGFHCQNCHITTGLEIDHVVPVIKGGANDLTNLQLLCKPCNCSKGDRA